MILDVIIHEFHMQDLWTMMKPMYDELVRNPPKNKELCPCIKDIENNQILKYMKWMATGNKHDGKEGNVFNKLSSMMRSMIFG